MDKKFFDELEKSKIKQLEKLTSEFPAKFCMYKQADGNVEMAYNGTNGDVADIVWMGITHLLQNDPELGLMYAIRLNKVLNMIYKQDPIIEQAIKICNRRGIGKED